MTMQDIASEAMMVGDSTLVRLYSRGLTRSDNFFIRVVRMGCGGFSELHTHVVGGGARFALDTSPEHGMIATVLECGMNSGDAADKYGDHIPDGPKRQTGGVIKRTSVRLDGERYGMVFVGAASGGLEEEEVSEAVMEATLGAMATIWRLCMKARHAAGIPLDDLVAA